MQFTPRWALPIAVIGLAACADSGPLSGPALPEARRTSAAESQSLDALRALDRPTAVPAGWADIYDPFVLRSYHVQLKRADWETIRNDGTFDVKVPAMFWMNGDAGNAYLSQIRRKSATPIGDKISYRLKFDTLVNASGRKPARFFDVKTFSLENGDDADVVREGLAWYLHRLAASDNYKPGLAAWALLTLHLERDSLADDGTIAVDPHTGAPLVAIDTVPQGVYVNVEMPDKHFLRHRGMWTEGGSTLYKQDDIGPAEMKEPEYDGPIPDGARSPADNFLTYDPFVEPARVTKSTPTDPQLELDLRSWINMSSMLRLGAVNAYTDNPDELFNKGKNFYWVDFTTNRADYRRSYFPWDLDAVIRSTSGGIYSTGTTVKGKTTTYQQHAYQSTILNHSVFRADYNRIMLELLNGPMSVSTINGALTRFETLLTPALTADPNSKLNAPAGVFSDLRNWIGSRDANVRAQVAANSTPKPRAGYTSTLVYTLSVAKSGSGTGTVVSAPGGIDCGAVCSGSFGSNTAVTLTATPGEGFLFNGWSGACSGMTLSCTLTITANRSVGASFVQVPVLRTVSLHGMTGGYTTAKGGTWTPWIIATVRQAGTSTPIVGATVAVTWSGLAAGAGSCLTAADGSCRITAQSLKSGGSVTFVVESIAGDYLTYDPTMNLVSPSYTVVK
jgi:hypothetical protein